jgi:cyclase
MTLVAPLSTELRSFEAIPSLDLLDGKAVRLQQGDFDRVTPYGDPLEIARGWRAAGATRLHVVDLDGARSGLSSEATRRLVRELVGLGFRLQIGGGIRNAKTAADWIAAGAEKIVVGTVAVDRSRLAALVDAVGAEQIIAAVDVRDGVIRTEGWRNSSSLLFDDVVDSISASGVSEILVTDIARDGELAGPCFELYRSIAQRHSIAVLASGGVASLHDITSLARNRALSGVVIGKALHEGRFSMEEAAARVGAATRLRDRVIACLDIRGGRVVKGTRFTDLRDAGDPVECARRYEREGADEIVALDISATAEERSASLEVVSRIAANLFIPLVVGGGVRTVEDFGTLVCAGADRVAINTAAVERPALIAECAREFGTQAVVVACDARRSNGRFEVVVRAGGSATGLEAAEWCRRAELEGAGEILLTSIDRDGTRGGFDLELLRAVSSAVKIGVIASGGAGRAEDFFDALESGGARAVLAAGLFHDGIMSIGDVKSFLSDRGVPVR